LRSCCLPASAASRAGSAECGESVELCGRSRGVATGSVHWMRVPSPPLRGSPAQQALPRRHLLTAAASLLPLLAPPDRTAAALPFGLFGGPSARPTVEVLSASPACQGRVRLQDFAVIRYTGRFSNGTVFDARYREQPLIYELGAFYLPGVDAALENQCAGTKLRLRYAESPILSRPEDAALLPAGSAIELEVELVTIKYSLFGEKMRGVTDTYYFAPFPLTLTSPVDERGHASSRTPEVIRDNPFAIAPNENSIISNPKGVLTPLFDSMGGQINFPGLNRF